MVDDLLAERDGAWTGDEVGKIESSLGCGTGPEWSGPGAHDPHDRPRRAASPGVFRAPH